MCTKIMLLKYNISTEICHDDDEYCNYNSMLKFQNYE